MPFQKKTIQSTNPIALILNSLDLETLCREEKRMDALDVLARAKIYENTEKYEEKEGEIPKIIYEVLRKESMPFTKLLKRTYIEEDAWLVRVECKEGEYLEDHGQEVYSSDSDGDLIPALLEENVSMHFIKIHVPKIFVSTIALPMILGNH